MIDAFAPFKHLGLETAVFLPIPKGKKFPCITEWQKKTLADMTDPAYLRLFQEDGNIGVRLGVASDNLCVIDIDADEWVGRFLAANPGLAATLRTRGSRGCSFWVWIAGEYPSPCKLKDSEGNDVMEWRADGQQSVIHGLHPKGMAYQRIIDASPISIPFEEINWPDGLTLPWLASDNGKPVAVTNVASGTYRQGSQSNIDHVRKYIAKMPPAISGQNGHGQTLAVACAIIKGFNLTVDDARPLLREYSERCQPPWTDIELEHKLFEANKLPDGRPRGYLVLPEDSGFQSDIRTGTTVIRLPGNGITISECARTLFSLISPSHTMFIRGNRVVEISQGSDGRIQLQIVTPSAFRSRVEKFGSLMAWRSGKGNDPVLKPTPMPEETAKALLDTKEARELLPPIESIINCPVLKSDGAGVRIIGKGYDPSGLLVTGGETPPFVPLDEAIEKNKLLIGEFDFASPGDRSRALASLITPALKIGGHIKGFVPADVAEADQSQAGKTYRQRIIAAIYNEVPAIIAKRDGGVGSLDESLAQKLLNGSPFIQLDNVRGKTDSQYLEALLTADKKFSVRIPHHGEVEINPEGFFILLTSNGVETTRDFANRSSIIRIRKRPEHHFKVYPEGDLLSHVRANQAYYLGCVYAVIREWIAKGRPKTDETRHDFREWAQALDWIIQNIFKEAPLMERHQETQERISNPAMTFLRNLAVSLKTTDKLDRELLARAIYGHCDEESIEIPGLKGNDTKAGQQAIGRIMAKIFQSGDAYSKVTCEGFIVERKTSKVYDKEQQENIDRKFYKFTLQESNPVQLSFPPNPTHPT